MKTHRRVPFAILSCREANDPPAQDRVQSCINRTSSTQITLAARRIFIHAATVLCVCVCTQSILDVTFPKLELQKSTPTDCPCGSGRHRRELTWVHFPAYYLRPCLPPTMIVAITSSNRQDS